jgi:hypothetical protein
VGKVVKKILVVLVGVILCISSLSIAAGIPNLTGENETQIQSAKIPNMTEDEGTNGRPQHLDTDDRTGEDLTPVEQKIIQRDTIQSNQDTSIPVGGSGN